MNEKHAKFTKNIPYFLHYGKPKHLQYCQKMTVHLMIQCASHMNLFECSCIAYNITATVVRKIEERYTPILDECEVNSSELL